MIVPNLDFRPNPDRAVYVHGPIDHQLIYTLTPQIIFLQNKNRSPITVYIDSPGGEVTSMEALLKVLRASNQDAAPPCRIITIVISSAASAAADLLSSGDYALAMPQSSLLYHGVRTTREIPLTVEDTSLLAQYLRILNETYAMELVQKIENRFMLRFLLSKNQFQKIREEEQKELTDTQCFLDIVNKNLSYEGQKIFATAKSRYGKYEQLLKTIKKIKADNKSVAKTEAGRLKAIIDFEVKNNRANKRWTFRMAGLTQVTDDFFLLNEHLDSAQSERLNRLCSQWGRFSLSVEDKSEIDGISDKEGKDKLLIQKVRPLLEPLWAFCVALCHALQGGENRLTAADAVWLGLIDEVMGDTSIPSLRMIAEYKEDPPPGSDQNQPPSSQ